MVHTYQGRLRYLGKGKYSYETYIPYHRPKENVSSVLIVNWQL